MNYIDLVKKEIQKLLPGVENFSVEIPELSHGDLTTNICLVASKTLKVSPEQVFKSIEKELNKNLVHVVEKIEFANPGFVNFYFKSDFVRNKLSPKKHWWGFFLPPPLTPPQAGGEIVPSLKYFDKKVLVEHSSPNLFKPFHIGHLVNNFTGEFLVRVLREVKAKVSVISYPSDISIGIAKAIYIIKSEGGLEQEIFQKSEDEVIKYLSSCYVRGVAEYKKFEEENIEGKIKEVKEIANNLFRKVSSEDLQIYEYTRKLNVEYLFSNLEKLGSNFDGFIFESETGDYCQRIILKNTGEGKAFQKSEGAIIYKPEEDRKDINTTVFINSEGNPTYAGKDIGLLDLKFKKFPNTDYSFFVTDNEQSPHFRAVLAAAESMGGEFKKYAKNSHHVSHGRMTFKGQKMSSRLGGVPSAEDVINVVYEDIKERSGEKIKDLDDEQKKKLQMEIALSALRISILRSKPGVNIDFDPEKASSFEGDSGPYLCYSHARCRSLLEKGKEKDLSPRNNFNSEITNIERKVLQFGYILKVSAEEIAPQKLVKYLFDLAGEFNSFYAAEKIISDNKEKSEHNLYLTKLVKDTISKGLYILGINAPEKM